MHGWAMGYRDIGWAESIALELMVLMIIANGFNDCLMLAQGDNTGIIGAFNKGRSQNIPQNKSI